VQLASTALWACSPAGPGEDDLTVFAAASLRDVFVDLEEAWLAAHPGATLTVAHEASNVLAAQIVEGAPVDVFVSADVEHPQQLFDDGLTAAAPVPFARNRVALVVPADEARVRAPADLAAAGVRIVAAAAGVPITRYADEALAQLALTMPDPEAFAAAVAANVVSREDNVRAALAKVELGEGDAAVVYRSDAASSERVRQIAWPEAVEVSADYAAVQVSDRPLAAGFVAWLAEDAALAIISSNGLEVPPA
jgi:molybdate transport system substrate-binding protein